MQYASRVAGKDYSLPPGRWWPAFVQTAIWVFRPVPFLRAQRAKYGDTFSVKLLNAGTLVMTADPAEIRKVFTGPADNLHAGKANVVLAPVVGENSVLTLDGAPHMHQRKLLLPPFHGERMRRYLETMEALTEEAIDRWPRDRSFRMREEAQAVTMDIILRVVFGITDPDRRRLFRDRMNAIEPQRWFKRFALLGLAQRFKIVDDVVFGDFNRAMDAFDALMYEEIANRRAVPDAERGDDILSLLLQARDEDGDPMTDHELRDELVTLVVAGHETTTTAVAWTFELMLRKPEVWRHVVDEARSEDGGFDYVDAVIKESLRLRPPIPAVARVIMDSWEVGGYTLPRGAVVAPQIYLSHYRPETWGDPEEFRPERFIGEQPEGSVFLPFGGGIRRCIGASFALYEMRAVIQTIARNVDVRLVRDVPERIARRAIIFAPGKDVPVTIVDDPMDKPAAAGQAREPVAAAN